MAIDLPLDLRVREARAEDAPRIVALAKQLGYDVNLKGLIGAIRDSAPERAAFVATVATEVVAWIQVSIRTTLLASNVAEIEGLVVDERYRSQQVGSLLLQTAREWARAHSCTVLRVRSNVVRERAHGFYERHGFQRVKTQHVFEESL